MSEEEIIQTLKDYLEFAGKLPFKFEKEEKAIAGLLDLYNKEKEYAMGLYYDNQCLQQDLDEEKEKNKKLFEEYNKRVSTIIKYEQTIKTAIDEFEDVLEE